MGGEEHLSSLRAAAAARWDTVEIPRQMYLSVVVLISKKSNDYRGKGLLEVVWKVLEGVLNGRMKEVKLHDALHGFRQKRGGGTGIMEAKLVYILPLLSSAPSTACS